MPRASAVTRAARARGATQGIGSLGKDRCSTGGRHSTLFSASAVRWMSGDQRKCVSSGERGPQVQDALRPEDCVLCQRRLSPQAHGCEEWREGEKAQVEEGAIRCERGSDECLLGLQHPEDSILPPLCRVRGPAAPSTMSRRRSRMRRASHPTSSTSLSGSSRTAVLFQTTTSRKSRLFT